jgi:hypothetical protein
MKTVTELTPKELALVQNDEIDLAKENAEKDILKGDIQVKATYNFFADFKLGGFEVVEEPYNQTSLVFNYLTGDYYLKEGYQVNKAYIQHKETKIRITIEEHYVSRGRSCENKGYKMFCYILGGNRAYSKASTIEKKLIKHLDEGQ